MSKTQSNDSFEFKDYGLKQFEKLLKGKLPMAKVGVLGQNGMRLDADGPSNAEIGAKHEFGEDGMPIRSFLRIPISENLQKYINKAKAFDEETLKQVIAEGSVLQWVKRLGILGEALVADAFATGGFGKWKPSNMAYKKNQQTLVETGQLRNSITSDVDES